MKKPGVVALGLGGALCLSSVVLAMADGGPGQGQNRHAPRHQARGVERVVDQGAAPIGEAHSVTTLRDGVAVGLYEREGRIERVYGAAFSHGNSPTASAQAFLDQHAGMLGTRTEDLLPVGPFADGRHLQGLMYQPDTDDYKFTAVFYMQARQDIPVFRSKLSLLTRNETDYPLVLASVDLRDLGQWEPDLNTQALNLNAGVAAAQAWQPALFNFSDGDLVIWAGIGDVSEAPRLAYTFVGDNGQPLDGTPVEKWLFVTDASTGTILYQESMILDVDVTGNVSGYATEAHQAQECAPEVLTPMPYAWVGIAGGSSAYADVNGDFVIPHGGSSNVTVNAEVRGLYFYVNNVGGTEATLSQIVSPPGPANFVFNTGGGELTTAEVNCYYEANVVRDAIILANPSYPGISGETNWPINVNYALTCNAYYDYASINFYQSGGGCNNTGFGDVVHHEYGHHLVASGGSGQGMYGEGMGDCLGVINTGRNELGVGFQSCAGGIRDANNTFQYPCSGAIHYCGQLISGCIWDLRAELMVTEPADWWTILNSLTVNSVLLHSGTEITPSITVDFLTLDDDDPDIGNGTPHYFEINTAFSAHNMPGPTLHPLSFSYPVGKPATLNPDEATNFEVNVAGVSDTPVPGTGVLHYNLNDGGWQTVAMVELTANEYRATLPAADCLDSFAWYVSAQSVGSGSVNDPFAAPTASYSSIVATDVSVVFEDDFQTNLGWTVSGTATDGQWDRGIPVNCNRGDPPTDSDGSGQCYLTDNSAASSCNSDVDGGITYLISPTIDLSAGDAAISFDLWYDNAYGADPNNDLFKIWVSNNNGSSYTLVETVGPTTPSGGWNGHSFNVGDYVTPTSTVKVRFEAADLNSGSVVEAGIDAFSVSQFICSPPVGCPEDLDGIFGVSQGDLNLVLNRWGDPACLPGGGSDPCPEDIDGINGVGQGDLNAVLNRWGDPDCE